MKELPKTLFYLGRKYELRIRRTESNHYLAYYYFHTNDKHDIITIPYIPSLFSDDIFTCGISMFTQQPTKEEALKTLLDKLNTANKNAFTWE